jgi:hypothetical protein
MEAVDDSDEEDADDPPPEPDPWQGWSVSASAGAAYVNHPGNVIDTRADLCTELLLAGEKDFALGRDLALTFSLGLSRLRYSAQSSRNTDEAYAGLFLAWKATSHWRLSLGESKSWDLVPPVQSVDSSTRVDDLRLQYDAPAHATPLRWQIFADLVSSHASAPTQDFHGLAVGLGTAVQAGAQVGLHLLGGLAAVRYPGFNLPDGSRREGVDLFLGAAAVWHPQPAIEASLGVTLRRYDENAPVFRFDVVQVPLLLTLSL